MKRELDRLEDAKQSVTGKAPYQVSATYTLPHHMVTTAFELEGYRIVRNLGVVRGITVRSRSVIGSIAAGLQTIVGGNITVY
ncbi:MAG TPA: heavy metal-binding domain-containing protein, partial [Acidobacteriota bacterium]|nr:heavy metal-binding domain-containing protein [Acidobacteriota bacterium]